MHACTQARARTRCHLARISSSSESQLELPYLRPRARPVVVARVARRLELAGGFRARPECRTWRRAPRPRGVAGRGAAWLREKRRRRRPRCWADDDEGRPVQERRVWGELGERQVSGPAVDKYDEAAGGEREVEAGGESLGVSGGADAKGRGARDVGSLGGIEHRVRDEDALGVVRPLAAARWPPELRAARRPMIVQVGRKEPAARRLGAAAPAGGGAIHCDTRYGTESALGSRTPLRPTRWSKRLASGGSCALHVVVAEVDHASSWRGRRAPFDDGRAYTT